MVARQGIAALLALGITFGLFYLMRFGSGIAVVLGALLFIYSMLVVRREIVKPGPVAVPGE